VNYHQLKQVASCRIAPTDHTLSSMARPEQNVFYQNSFSKIEF